MADDKIANRHNCIATGGIYEKAHFFADRCRFCRVISNCGRRKGKETKTKHRGRGDSEAARQYPTCSKGRAPTGAAKLVAPILFRYAPRRDEEQKGRKANPRQIAALANLSGAAKSHVRFTPKSGHVRCTSPCLLWANLECAPGPGAKRTCRFALHMSAYDPKRTSPSRRIMVPN